MKSIRNRASIFLLALSLGSAALPALADDACLDFKWDVSKERALFASMPASLNAAKDPVSAPAIVPNRLYALRLAAQDQVAFPLPPPTKKMAAASAYAGIVTLKISTPGSYRVAVDLPLWIDVVSNGSLAQPTDFQGQHECSAPHKIVVFEFNGAGPFVLQLSSAAKDSVLLTVTPAPPRTL
jgi:hypothetical protein